MVTHWGMSELLEFSTSNALLTNSRIHDCRNIVIDLEDSAMDLVEATATAYAKAIADAYVSTHESECFSGTIVEGGTPLRSAECTNTQTVTSDADVLNATATAGDSPRSCRPLL